MWEYEMFLEFLEERLCKDEMYFFLHVRNILFRGPQLLDSRSTFERVHFIPTTRAISLVDTIFKKVPQEEIDKLK
jgi:hypothetical protein